MQSYNYDSNPGFYFRRKKWLINMRRSDLRHSMSHEELMQGGYVVCELHFEECYLKKVSSAYWKK